MSQAELGRRVRVHQSTINGMIHGDQQGTTKLHQIARELRTTPAYLTGETDDPSLDAPHAETFSSEEREWIELLRDLDRTERLALLTVTRSMARTSKPPTLHSPAQEFRRTGTHG